MIFQWSVEGFLGTALGAGMGVEPDGCTTGEMQSFLIASSTRNGSRVN